MRARSRPSGRSAAPTPQPGPIRTALRLLSARTPASPSGTSKGVNMMAVRCVALTGNAARGLATVTRPAPILSAPRAPSRIAPVLSAGPETATTWPRAYLCASGFDVGRTACHSAGALANVRGRTEPSTCSGDTDVSERHLAAKLTARQQEMAGLAAEERHRPRRRDDRTGRRACRAIETARHVDRQHRNARRVDGGNRVGGGASDRSREARAKQPVDDEVAVPDRRCRDRLARAAPARRHRCGIALERTPVTDQCEAHAVALLCQPPSRDEAIAAIVAGAGEDEDACADVDHAAGGVGDRCAGTFHEVKRRHAGRDCETVGFGHLHRRQQFDHSLRSFRARSAGRGSRRSAAARYSRTAIASAAPARRERGRSPKAWPAPAVITQWTSTEPNAKGNGQ